MALFISDTLVGFLHQRFLGQGSVASLRLLSLDSLRGKWQSKPSLVDILTVSHGGRGLMALHEKVRVPFLKPSVGRRPQKAPILVPLNIDRLVQLVLLILMLLLLGEKVIVG